MKVKAGKQAHLNGTFGDPDQQPGEAKVIPGQGQGDRQRQPSAWKYFTKKHEKSKIVYITATNSEDLNRQSPSSSRSTTTNNVGTNSSSLL